MSETERLLGQPPTVIKTLVNPGKAWTFPFATPDLHKTGRDVECSSSVQQHSC